ncbi:MAG TPA: M56 family metallopeptidase [Thermoanaerobaculia bacterium]|jgi:beta-lactamase regulating signal transducer with metallopeptidase domain
MNAMELLTGPLAQAIGWALLHLLWEATIVAVILGAALMLLSKQSAGARYAACCAALAIVFAMFVATAIRAYDPAVAPVVTRATLLSTVAHSDAPVVQAIAKAPTWRERAMVFVASAHRSLPLIVGLWLAGVAFFSARLLVSWTRARRLLRRGAHEARAEWLGAAARISQALGLRRAVRLLESAAVEVPSVIGSLRPVILLPASTLTGLTPDQIEMVLAHELAHIRRHDFLVNLLQAFVETLMFYHPAVWWMSQRARVERENCCDDLAVAVCGNPLQYARALTRLEELRADAPVMVVAANGGSLFERIRRIATRRSELTSTTPRWAAAVTLLALLAAGAAVPTLPALAQREKAAKKSEPRKSESKESRAAADAKVDVIAPSAARAAADADARRSSDVDVDVNEDIDLDLDNDYEYEYEAPEPPEPPDAPEPAVAPRVRVFAPDAPVPPGEPSAPRFAPAAPPAPMALAMMDDDERERGERHRSRSRKFGEDGKLTIDELIQLRAVGVTPEYITEMRGLFPNVPLGDVVSARALGVTSEYVRNMRAAGLQVDDLDDARDLAAVGVQSEWLREMREAGVKITSTRDAKQMRAVGVNPRFVKQLAEAGYSDLSPRELTRLAALGINGDFIREMSKYRDH